MKTIYVACLAHRHTGGLTLAHQLCYELVKQGFSAKMFYYYGYGQTKSNPVNENYKKYNLEYVTKFEDSDDCILVVPETNVNLLRKVKKAKKIIWWMSVDNYFKTLKSKRYLLEDFWGLRRYNIKNNDIIHFAQSYYAIDFLKKQGINVSNIKYLSDYLDSEFLNESKVYYSKAKENIVLYNPKKGWDFTSELIRQSPEIQWFPLENLTPSQMKEKLGTSKVYIDFGNHPGKDRIPREAAIMGCCVITGKRGSARFHEDVKISQEYKFDDKFENISIIKNCILECFNNYELKQKDFDAYVQMIINEQKKFQDDVSLIFKGII